MSDMERLTMTSEKGGVAFTFDLDITCKPSEAQKILRLAERLKHYEDLAEQGRLIELPCKVGDTVWFVNERIYECIVDSYVIYKTNVGISLKYCMGSAYVDIFFFGKTVFLTKAEAEAKLKELEG